MSLVSQPLLLLHTDADLRAQLCRVLPAQMVLVEVASWHALEDAVERAAPGAVCVVDPYLGRSPGRLSSALAALLRQFPRLPVLCAAPFSSHDLDDVLQLGRWGAADAFVTRQDHETADLGACIQNVRDAYFARVLRAIPTTGLSAAQVAILREALHVAAGWGRAGDWAWVLGISKDSLWRRTSTAGLPPARRLLAWMRVLFTADLLANPGHNVRTASAACGYAAEQPLRRVIRQMIGVDAAALAGDENALGRVATRFGEELARGGAAGETGP